MSDGSPALQGGHTDFKENVMRQALKLISLLAIAECGLLSSPSFAGDMQAGDMQLAQMESDGGSIGGAMGAAPSSAHARARTTAQPAFDGAWAVTSGGPCIAAGTSQVTISGSRIISPMGSGSVTPAGVVSTVSSFNGLTITGKGRIVGRTASGSYRQSDGCAGTWSAVKL
jgi:hypothetical protein